MSEPDVKALERIMGDLIDVQRDVELWGYVVPFVAYLEDELCGACGFSWLFDTDGKLVHASGGPTRMSEGQMGEIAHGLFRRTGGSGEAP